MDIPVEISNLPEVNSEQRVHKYVAKTPGECKDKVDLLVFNLVQDFGTLITLGSVVGRPVGPDYI